MPVVAGFFFLSGALQIVFPPYPGDTVFLFGACLQGMGLRAGWLAPASYLVGVLAFSVGLFLLGRRVGRAIFSSRFVERYFPKALRDKAEAQLKRFGLPLLFLCKFIPGINTAAILLGGVLRYPAPASLCCITAAALVHGAAFAYAGVRIGGSWQAISAFLGVYSRLALLIGGALCLGFVLYLIVAGRRRPAA